VYDVAFVVLILTIFAVLGVVGKGAEKL